MKQEDLDRMNRFFQEHSYDKEPADPLRSPEAAHDEEDGAAAGVAYFSEEGELLLLRRVDAGQMWSFPCGTVEEGETAEECACREFKEETGQDCPPCGGSTSFLNDDGLHATIFQAIGPRFDPRLCDEHDVFMWATADNLPLPLHPGVAKALLGLPSNKE